MRFLLDEHMPRSLNTELVKLGHESLDARDIGLAGMPDSDLFARAAAEHAIIITRDRGFAAEKFWPEAFTSGIIY